MEGKGIWTTTNREQWRGSFQAQVRFSLPQAHHWTWKTEHTVVSGTFVTLQSTKGSLYQSARLASALSLGTRRHLAPPSGWMSQLPTDFVGYEYSAGPHKTLNILVNLLDCQHSDNRVPLTLDYNVGSFRHSIIRKQQKELFFFCLVCVLYSLQQPVILSFFPKN
jgi:hypothetical protein